MKNIFWENLLKDKLDKNGIALINGFDVKLVNWYEFPFAISFFDLGFRRGSGVFEVMVAKERKVFHIKDHIKRLKESMKQMEISIPVRLPFGWLKIYFFDNFLEGAIKEVLEMNSGRWSEYPYSLVFVFLTGGFSEDGMISKGSNLYIMTQQFIPQKFEERKALKLKFLYHIPDLANIKTMNNYWKASSEIGLISKKGYDDILYGQHSHVTECSRANFFIIKNDKIKTAPERSIVPGITRSVTISLAKKLGYEVEENYIKLEELSKIDEAFITSTIYGVWPVRMIDVREVDSRIGKVILPATGMGVLRLRNAFIEYQKDFLKL